LLDKKEELILDLNNIYALLMKVLIIEEHEYETLKIEDYEDFYEYIQYEGSIMNEVKEVMKDIVPELIYYRDEPKIENLLESIEDINKKILKKNVGFQNDVKDRIGDIKKRLTSLNHYVPSDFNVSTILSIRA